MPPVTRAAHNGPSTRDAKGGSDDRHGVRGRVARARGRWPRACAGSVGGDDRRRRPRGASGHPAGDGGLRVRRPQAAVPQRLQRQRGPRHPARPPGHRADPAGRGDGVRACRPGRGALHPRGTGQHAGAHRAADRAAGPGARRARHQDLRHQRLQGEDGADQAQADHRLLLGAALVPGH
ncbi:conserved hypothetical protein, partial [Ricinus communis]